MRHKKGEKWALGEAKLLETKQALRFTDDAVVKAGTVLEALLDSGSDKERRLAAERIRDERGFTRMGVVKPVEHATITLELSQAARELLANPPPPKPVNRLEQHPALQPGWKAPIDRQAASRELSKLILQPDVIDSNDARP